MRAHNFQICVVLSACFVAPFIAAALFDGDGGGPVPVSDGPTVRKDDRWPLVSSEFGEISAVKIKDGSNGSYYLQFVTMEPHSLFLPVLLHSEMVLYVNSGGGTLTWTNLEKSGKLQEVRLLCGDIYRLTPDTLFYLQNNFDTGDPQKLQIYAIFSDSVDNLKHRQSAGAYTAVHDLVLGFDDKVLQATFSVPEEVIQELRGGERQPLIVQDHQVLPGANNSPSYVSSPVIRAFLRTQNNGIFDVENGKKAYNIFKADRDVENCNGWSVTVTEKQLDVLKHSQFGIFMVNLAAGSMMEPHWNPISAEVAVVLHGRGMVQVVCPSILNETGCTNSRFKVEEGDVFMVPQHYPMAQLSFNNDSLVFVGFTIMTKHIHAEYLTGKESLFKMLNKDLLAASFNVSDTTIYRILAAKKKSFILECMSCAEEEEMLMEEKSEEEEGERHPESHEERETTGTGEEGGGGRHESEGKGETTGKGEQEEGRRYESEGEGESTRREEEEGRGKHEAEKEEGGRGQHESEEKGEMPGREEEGGEGETTGTGEKGGGGHHESEGKGETTEKGEQEEGGRHESKGERESTRWEEEEGRGSHEAEKEKGGGGQHESKDKGETPRREEEGWEGRHEVHEERESIEREEGEGGHHEMEGGGEATERMEGEKGRHGAEEEREATRMGGEGKGGPYEAEGVEETPRMREDGGGGWQESKREEEGGPYEMGEEGERST